ncbi:MAG: hypothetical protein KDA65_03085 [Planctomycetaceae bacterium]|nr:hypothetical protein [Planctomycetaceae bacterium]
MKRISITPTLFCLLCVGLCAVVQAGEGPQLNTQRSRVEVVDIRAPQPPEGQIQSVSSTEEIESIDSRSVPAVSPRAKRPSFPLYGKRTASRRPIERVSMQLPQEMVVSAQEYTVPTAGESLASLPSQKQISLASHPQAVTDYSSYCQAESFSCHCGQCDWCSAYREYTLCHGCSEEDNICVENFKRRWPGQTLMDRWYCDPWLRAYTIQPAGCCDSKTWYKFE